MASSSSQSIRARRATFHLPIDLTIEILSRLPVKSLLRFKSVCKTWYALIQSPNFIAKHLINHQKSSILSTLLTTWNRETSDYGMSLLPNDGFDCPTINLGFPFLTEGDYNELEIVGVCNGLVCIYLSDEDNDQLILCNPATRQFRKIPNHRWWDSEVLTISWVTFGFGFHKNANDFKLIRVVYYYCDSNIDELNVRADMYEMSTDNWTEIDDKMWSISYAGVDVVFPGQIITRSASAFLNGVFYWEAYGYPINDAFVVSFDVGAGMFQRMTTPPCFNVIRYSKLIWQLTALMDKLAVIIYSDDRSFDVWVLSEKGTAWTKQFSVGPVPRIVGPLRAWESDTISWTACAENGEIVVHDHTSPVDLNLYLYDPKRQETRNLHFGEVGCIHQIYLYTETLFQP